MRIFSGIYFWTTGFFITFLFYLAVLTRVVIMKLKGEVNSRPVHNIASLWGKTVLKLMSGWKISVEGLEHLPKTDQPMVVVANHESLSDIWVMYYLGIQFRWLSKAEVFKAPMIGRVMRHANYVPVERGNKSSHRAAMQQCAARLQEGLCMFFFPEGTRSKDGKIQAFKSGAFRLARDEQVPVLPIAIHGAGDLLPKGTWIPNPANVKVKILPPHQAPTATENIEAYASQIRSDILDAHQSWLH